jgi:hypothetical protein
MPLASLAALAGLAVWDLAAGARNSGRVAPAAGGAAALGGPSAPTSSCSTATATPSVTGGPLTRTPTRTFTPTTTPAPTIQGLSPSSGPAAGGSEVTLTGNFFLPGAITVLCGIDVHGLVVDPSHIEFTAPPFAPASLDDLRVTNPDGQSRGLREAWFADFLDVPASSAFHADIERLFRVHDTAGCGAGNFCPNALLSRAQMSVFVVRGNATDAVAPPCSQTIFADVPCPGGRYVNWVNYLAGMGITAGCGGGNFCPDASVTRAQLAVLLLKRTHDPSWTPPACASTVFSDVPCPGGTYVDWVNEFAAEGLTSGCGGGLFCPGAPVSRQQMASFLVRTFWPSPPP